jgi:hypothetical protein
MFTSIARERRIKLVGGAAEGLQKSSVEETMK